MTRPRFARVLLVGFMGSGKTTVGSILAESLGWPLVDFDAYIEELQGRTIEEIVRRDGEGAFRRVEVAAANELLSRDEVVLAAGGGWAGVPGRLRSLPPETLSVWLRVSLDEALRRAARQPGTRPLLAGEDYRERARVLLAERTPAYAEASLEVDTDGRTQEDVSAHVLKLMGSQPYERRSESAVKE